MESDIPNPKETILALVLAVLSLVLQIIGLSTRGWIVLYSQTSTSSWDVAMGLWAARYCINGDCDTRTLPDFFDFLLKDYVSVAAKSEMSEYRAETVIAMIAMVCVCLCLIVILHHEKHISHVMIFVLSAISAILALVAACKFGMMIKRSHEELGKASPYLMPYSLFITGVGGVIAAIVSVIAFILICQRRRRRWKYFRKHHHDVTVETISESTVYPDTKEDVPDGSPSGIVSQDPDPGYISTPF